MDKSNKENILNEKVETLNVLHSKDPVKSNALGSHGMKLSVNMTSQDKKEFLLKLEEWRKARREKFVNNVSPKQKGIIKSSKVSNSSLPLRNKSNEISVSDKKSDEVDISERKESVFDRLYKNAKRVRNPDTKHSQISCEVFKKPTGLNMIKTNKPLKVSQGKALSKSFCQEDKINIPFKTDSGLPSPKEVEQEINGEIQHQFDVKETVNADNSRDAFYSLKNNKIMQMEPENKSPDNQNEMGVNKGKFFNFGELSSGIDKTEIPFHSNCLNKSPIIEQKRDEPIKSQGFHLKGDRKRNSPTNEDLKKKNSTLIPASESLGSEKGKAKIQAVNTNILSVNQGVKKVTESAKYRPSLRRSISMIYRKQCKMSSTTRQKSLSERSLFEIKSSYHYTAKDLNIKSVSRPVSSSYLRNQLEDWLKLNGHSLEGYRHLRCFDITNDGKNLLHHTSTKADLNDSSKPTCNDTPSKPTCDEANQENIYDVEKWLKELYRLIVEVKYPSDRCEEWLSAIKKKYEACDKSYLYWECLAALDESKCNVESAKKAEADEIADSLTELFDKMVIEQQKPSKIKIERGLDVKNIFKSTVIKFALQEKTAKELDSKLGQDVQQQQLYVATPVRRSSRIKAPCDSHVVSSLHSVTPEVRRNLTFKPNDSLIE